MIYFEKETLRFPRHSAEISNKMTIVNELTGDVQEVEFTDLSVDDRYYLIDCSDLELKDGTYRYQIGHECGLMQVGDYVATSTEYNVKKTNTVYER